MATARLAKFIQQFFSVPVYIWQRGNMDAREFEQEHCFQPECQPRNTASYLEKLQGKMKEPVLLHIQETLGTTILLLGIEGCIILIGPFTELEWNEHIAESALAKVGSSASYLVQYKNYYCRYSVWSVELVIQAVKAFLAVECVDITHLEFDRIAVAPHGSHERRELMQDADGLQINKRYQMEGEFMDAMQRGKKVETLAALARMQSVSPRNRFNKSNAMDQAIGFTIWRTLCRTAARQSGLPPVVIDSISQEYSQKLNHLQYGQTIRYTSPLIEEMAIEYCDAIAAFKRESYPVMVRKAIDYIRLNLGTQLSTAIVAGQLEANPAYLSKQFKNATGITLTKFIQQQRMKKAAEMLCSTDSSIQDISSYVGYEDNNYFVKVFKGQYSITPSEYRNKYMP